MSAEDRPREILRIRAHDTNSIPAAGLAIERLAGSVGLPSLDASRFRFAIEELCADRIANGFATSQAPEVDLRLELHPGEITVLVDDTGTPLDPSAAGAGARGIIAQVLEHGFVDELHASFRGREGNRCIATKFLRGARANQLEEAAASAPASDVSETREQHAPNPTTADIQYRQMRPEDAFEVARCFYRTYGLSGPAADEVVYHPERCAERVRAGLHVATIALAGDRVVGHTAFERESLDDSVAVGGYLVVDPEFRGHGIAERLTEIRFQHGREMELRGLLAMAVTAHTASQKTSLANGGHETGVLLAAQEARIVMRGIASPRRHERHSMVVFYFPWAEAARESYAPELHREIIGKIYGNCGLARTLSKPAQRYRLDALPEHSTLEVSILRGAHHARIRVKVFGRNFLPAVLHLVADLHHHHVSVIRLELPLSDPLTATFGGAAEELGFSFAAVFPSMAPGGGDLLCLQSLDRIELHPEDTHVASDFGQGLFKSVLESSERVRNSRSARTIDGAERALKAAAD
ncbi:MAG TPA: GNAT family N-acetyltransferase [Candidatus Binataceae bacterium]|nr:GNAT family N-acetyltransferase [Candidatus Binataceae bacterium]